LWLGPADHCPQTYRSVESGSITFTLSAITDYPLNFPVAWRGGRQAWNGARTGLNCLPLHVRRHLPVRQAEFDALSDAPAPDLVLP